MLINAKRTISGINTGMGVTKLKGMWKISQHHVLPVLIMNIMNFHSLAVKRINHENIMGFGATYSAIKRSS